MGKTHIRIGTRRVPVRYAPEYLSRKDRKAQIAALKRSRRAYKKGKYVSRPKLKSAKVRRSRHTYRAAKLYRLDPDNLDLKTLAKKAGCSMKAVNRILSKGRGAYYSSGSRPNQSAESWGIARVHSALSGGPSAKVDLHILREDCNKTSKALRLAKKLKGGGTKRKMRMKERIVRFEKSHRKGKKYLALIREIGTGKVRRVHFGGDGYVQYKDRTGLGLYDSVSHGDRKRMQRYFLRHSGTRHRGRAIEKEKRASGGYYTPKILSHIYLW